MDYSGRIHDCVTGVVEGEGFERAKRECLDGEKWSLFCCGYSFRGSKVSETVDRYNTYLEILLCSLHVSLPH